MGDWGKSGSGGRGTTAAFRASKCDLDKDEDRENLLACFPLESFSPVIAGRDFAGAVSVRDRDARVGEE